MKLDAQLAPASGQWLSGEEQTLLQNAVLGLPSAGLENVRLWGKITGKDADYLILVAQNKLEEEEDYPNQTFFFCTNKSFRLQQLPAAQPHPAVARTTAFTGSPSTELVAAVEPEPAAEEQEAEAEEGAAAEGAKGTPAYLERDHLATVVAEIHANTAVVPRGAFVADARHRVVRNTNFGGLSVADATVIDSYFHFRKPDNPLAVRNADGLIRPTDFLDRISTTHPEGAWTVHIDECDSRAVLRSLLYPGYTFYHAPGTSDFGGVYVGDGARNEDLAFML